MKVLINQDLVGYRHTKKGIINNHNPLHVSRGDPAIVYLDGVNPPTERMALSRSLSTPENFYSGGESGGGGGNGNGVMLVKAHSNHHQRLLQTIREDDCESR